MSKLDVFSQRYRHRVSGGLYDNDLWLHDYDEVQSESGHRGENDAASHNTHVDHELQLRQQIQIAVSYSQGSRGQSRLPDGPRSELADLYEQTNSDLRKVAAQPFDELFSLKGTASASEPVSGEKFERAARVLVFDYVEAIYDTLTASGKTEFSRELNQRLQAGGSPWIFVMGRWRREDWEAERDTPFDETLHRLRLQAENAQRRRLRARDGEEISAPLTDAAGAPPKAMLESLGEAAKGLASAERLLRSDPEIADYSNRKAVERAREAFDICASLFPDAVFGPFVDYNRGAKTDGAHGASDPYADLPSETAREAEKRTRLLPQEGGEAALLRLGQLYEYAGVHASAKEREALVKRAPMAEFLARLVLFGPSRHDDARYGKATRLHGLESAYGGHHAGKLPLRVSEIAEAQLAIDVLARLCLYAAGADLPADADLNTSGWTVRKAFQRARAAAIWKWVRRILTGAVLLLAGGAVGWLAASGVLPLSF
ncbi:MAG: hypothetical protein AAFX09_11235 [Pseudomonadota bacterium]